MCTDDSDCTGGGYCDRVRGYTGNNIALEPCSCGGWSFSSGVISCLPKVPPGSQCIYACETSTLQRIDACSAPMASSPECGNQACYGVCSYSML